ncbi:MAG: glycerol-3-phosphate 1-O-acyltransferase PlsY [Patescibacteria group bacterium]
MSFIAYILLAYLFGAIPWGYIIARLHGVNIQKRGSGNTGATNIYRTLGLPAAILVFLLDVFKGVFVMLIAKFSINNHYEVAALALAVILGHTFSIFLKGKGGKGVATTFGVLLILIGWNVMIAALFAAIGLVILTGYMSIASLILIWIFPGFFVFVEPDFAFFILGVLVTLLIYWEHRANIDRLKEGKELQLNIKIGLKPQKNAPPKIVSAGIPVKAVNSAQNASMKKRNNKKLPKSISKKAVNKPKKRSKKLA